MHRLKNADWAAQSKCGAVQMRRSPNGLLARSFENMNNLNELFTRARISIARGQLLRLYDSTDHHVAYRSLSACWFRGLASGIKTAQAELPGVDKGLS